MSEGDDDAKPPPPERGGGGMVWQVIVRCRRCDLMGQAWNMTVARDPVNKTIGLTIWVDAKCPRCGHTTSPS